MIKKTFLLLLLFYLLILHNAFAVTEFLITSKASGGDYTNYATAEGAIDEDLTAATIKVFSFSANTGTIADGDSVIGNTSLATGVCVHQSVGGQILIKTIAVSSFQSGEVVQKVGDASKQVTLSDNGDAPAVKLVVYNNQTSGLVIDGGTYSATNYLKMWGDTTNWNGKKANAVKLSGGTSSEFIAYADPYVEIAYFYHFLDTDIGGGEWIKGYNPVVGITLHHNFFERDSATYTNAWTVFRASDTLLYAKIYRNVFIGYWAKALFVAGGTDVGQETIIYNNIFDMLKIGGTDKSWALDVVGFSIRYFIKNNVFVNVSDAIDGHDATCVHQYNVTDMNDTDLNGTGDVVSSVTINLDADYFPQSTSTALIDQGANLGSPYDLDVVNYTVTGTWDEGAKEYVASGGGPTGPYTHIISNAVIKGMTIY